MQTIFIGSTGPTPIGELWVAVSENGLIAVEFPTTQADFITWLEKHHGGRVEFDAERVRQAVDELREYAAGQRREFSMPVDWSVLSDFQRRALSVTAAIPYGQTRSYKEVAIQLGNPRAARAVGRAEATNPMPVVLPCHRVVGSDGKLHGYGGGEGLPTKERLLKMEKALIA